MKRTGFTLLEVIISVTIFSIIITAVYGAFYMGIKTWRRGREERSLQEVRLGLLKIQKELKNTFFFSDPRASFTGTEHKMVFPLNISDGDREVVSIVTYRIDTDAQTELKEFIREERPFSEETGEAGEKVKRILPLMKSVRFEYAYKTDDPSKGFEWRGLWKGGEQKKLPASVRISLEPPDGKEIYHKVIFIREERLDIE